MALTEAEFISISEKVVKDIAKTCSSIPELSTSPLLDLALVGAFELLFRTDELFMIGLLMKMLI
eukprot:CAMPEP_0117854280 /NCGR_PEP_ID=MMETSP0949-20121206/24226_1 /TAXON_ID=44440 /ORGANISM="Chattonella subsalsa, Strain CCMP2191" /LENGTH=63 /DNA_ID=CAMNT_0005702909 /DNA_START=52 /DNA_END=243 /DNA_ORIENTATION=-